MRPWQRLIADIGTERLANGRPAFREVIFSVPRQCGKTTLVLCFELDRCVMWPDPFQRVVYSAQTGQDARRKLMDDQVPVVEASAFRGVVKNVRKAKGEESILFRTGSRIELQASDVGAGHGRTIDLAVIDEAFDDADDRREGAMMPAMKTRPSAQLLICSTAGTLDSIYLRRKVELGRKAAQAGRTEGVAYFEWAVPESEDVDDEATWWEYVPAMDETAVLSMRHARQTMPDGEFRRAFCNQWTFVDSVWINMVVWDQGSAAPEIPEGSEVYMGIDGAAKRDTTAVAIDRRDENGIHHVALRVFAAKNENEVIDQEVVENYIRDLGRRYRVIQASYDPHLFWPIAQRLQEEGFEMMEVQQNVSNKVLYSQAIYDVVMQGRIRHGGDPVMRAHAEAAAAKDRGGHGWTLEKVPSVTHRPNDGIIAVAMAVHAAEQQNEEEVGFFWG